MTEFAWDESLCIGIEELDEDHRKIFRMLDEFCVAAWGDEGQDDLMRRLDGLTDFFTAHVHKEDVIMEGFESAFSMSHKQKHEKEHEAYIYILGQIRNMLNSGHWDSARENAHSLQKLMFFRELVKTDYEMVRCMITEGMMDSQ